MDNLLIERDVFNKKENEKVFKSRGFWGIWNLKILHKTRRLNALSFLTETQKSEDFITESENSVIKTNVLLYFLTFCR